MTQRGPTKFKLVEERHLVFERLSRDEVLGEEDVGLGRDERQVGQLEPHGHAHELAQQHSLPLERLLSASQLEESLRS